MVGFRITAYVIFLQDDEDGRRCGISPETAASWRRACFIMLVGPTPLNGPGRFYWMTAVARLSDHAALASRLSLEQVGDNQVTNAAAPGCSAVAIPRSAPGLPRVEHLAVQQFAACGFDAPVLPRVRLPDAGRPGAEAGDPGLHRLGDELWLPVRADRLRPATAWRQSPPACALPVLCPPPKAAAGPLLRGEVTEQGGGQLTLPL